MTVLLAFTFLLAGGKASASAEVVPVTASKSDKCPVCGMFVAKYPDFLAQIIFTDGSYALFDGNKDMLKYYFNLKQYNASKELSDIAAIYVTDYYSMTPADGRTAWYVVGSDVFGPMGRELIPFVHEKDAAEFMKDHSGKKMIRFDQVTTDLMKGID
jgi:nitrous oxide reductase accessory protein NosL